MFLGAMSFWDDPQDGKLRHGGRPESYEGDLSTVSGLLALTDLSLFCQRETCFLRRRRAQMRNGPCDTIDPKLLKARSFEDAWAG
jgi:hypothetical protein